MTGSSIKDYFRELEIEKIIDKASRFTSSVKIKERIKRSEILDKKDVENIYGILRVMREHLDEKPAFSVCDDFALYADRIKAENSHLEVSEIADLYLMLRSAEKAAVFVRKFALAEQFPFTEAKEFLKKTEKALDIDERRIKKDATPELAELFRRQASQEKKITGKVQALLSAYKNDDLLTEDFFTFKDGRYVLPVSSSQKNRVNGIVHSMSQTGITTYIEPMEIVFLTNEMVTIQEDIRLETIKVLTRITDTVRENIESITHNSESIDRLEHMSALTGFMCEYNYTIPVIGEDILIKNGRHPILEWRQNVVSFDMKGEEFRILIITGPNTGGKTVLLKTLGLMFIMVKLALPVPANEGTSIPYYGNIYIDIADDQNIEESLSTFSSHLKKMERALTGFTSADAALFDEPGSGTETHLSDAFTIALIERLIKGGGKAFITTHSFKIKERTGHYPEAASASMVFDVNTLKPTYRLAFGVSGESYAVEIAQGLGLPADFLEAVRANLDKDYLDYKKLRTEADRLLSDNLAEKSKLTALIKEYTELRYKYEEGMKKAAREMKSEYVEKYLTLKKEAEELKKSISEFQKDRKASEERKIKKIITAADAAVGGAPAGEECAAGDRVKLFNSDNFYEVTEVSGKTIKLKVGDFVMEFPSSMIEDVRKKTDKTPEIAREEPYVASPAPGSIDIRGKTVDEAVYDVEKLVNDSYVSGAETVSILHGTGTGRLKEGIRRFLTSHPLVRTFYDMNDGKNINPGVTIVEIRK